MHRLLGRFVIGVGAFLIAAQAGAQGTDASSGRQFKLGGALGATIPLGDFGDDAELGFHLGGLIEYKPQAAPVTLRGEITYHRNSLKEGFFSDIPGGEDVDGNFSMINILGNAVIPFGDAASTARPYIIGGLGVYRFKFSGDIVGFDVSETTTKFGINAGAGFTFNLSGFETFIEGRFHSAFTEEGNTNFIPISFGFRF